ncbi:MAG TPA: hypothetical protein PLE24_11030 [Chitinispirillaceae bacterium]|nr:hypothetical protein [Chitinispirillaceae bacterium]
MSATISKKVRMPVIPHNPELVIITSVYNPLDQRLTVNIDNTGNDDAMTMLMHSQLLLSGYSADVLVIRNDKPVAMEAAHNG